MLVERIDESLVAFQLLFGLETKDIVYVKAKSSGEYTLKSFSIGSFCVFTPKAYVSDKVGEFLKSPTWAAFNFGDLILHAAVEKSLDLTIEYLEKAKFDEALERFQNLQSEINEICIRETIFPCSSDGREQLELSSENCYFQDSGCGYTCIDNLLASKKNI